MRQVKRWRYYCDYCKKSGGSKYHMHRHELRCVKNPDRNCEMCHYADGSPGRTKEMVSIVKDSAVCAACTWGESWSLKEGITEEDVLKQLRNLSDCPACILAALAQSEVAYLFDSFDYKAERESMWRCHNDAVKEDYTHYY